MNVLQTKKIYTRSLTCAVEKFSERQMVFVDGQWNDLNFTLAQGEDSLASLRIGYLAKSQTGLSLMGFAGRQWLIEGRRRALNEQNTLLT